MRNNLPFSTENIFRVYSCWAIVTLRQEEDDNWVTWVMCNQWFSEQGVAYCLFLTITPYSPISWPHTWTTAVVFFYHSVLLKCFRAPFHYNIHCLYYILLWFLLLFPALTLPTWWPDWTLWPQFVSCVMCSPLRQMKLRELKVKGQRYHLLLLLLVLSLQLPHIHRCLLEQHCYALENEFAWWWRGCIIWWYSRVRVARAD